MPLVKKLIRVGDSTVIPDRATLQQVDIEADPKSK
jgi:hypothetical protein